MPQPEPKRIFISFAKEDNAVVEELKRTLKPLTRQNGVEVWTFHDIPAGSDWDREIKEALGSASIVFLILSRNFLASDFIHTDELPEILRMSHRVVVMCEGRVTGESPFSVRRGPHGSPIVCWP